MSLDGIINRRRAERSIEAAHLASMSPHDQAMKQLIERLLVLGSVKSLAREVGDEAAARALHELTETAPEELQPSWPLVLAWGRVQASYEAAAAVGDSAEMRKAGESLAKLVTDRY